MQAARSDVKLGNLYMLLEAKLLQYIRFVCIHYLLT